MGKIIKSIILSALFLALAGMGTVWAEEAMPDLSTGSALTEELSMDAEPQMPGRVDSTGIYFEVKDSEWLDVSVASSELIKLALESVPNMITMHIEAAAGAASAQITIKGLAPQTTYHKYEDNYHNHEEFTTDDNGSYAYTQDLSVLHTVFIQTHKSTKFIKDDATGGDCYSIGIWDSSTKICTLTMDLNVNETIEIDSDGVTLDGNGHTLTGYATGVGVHIAAPKAATVKNLKIINFSYGIYATPGTSSINITGNTIDGSSLGSRGIFLFFPNNNTITNNTITHFGDGIILNCSSNNIINGNTVNSNSSNGIHLTCSTGGGSNNNSITSNTVNSNGSSGITLSLGSSNNNLTGNTFNSNSLIGIYLSAGNGSYPTIGNTITNNTVSNNRGGIRISGDNNIVSGNIISSNHRYGIVVSSIRNSTITNSSTITDNAVSDNYYGILLALNDSPLNCKTYNNNFINNQRQFRLYASGIFDLPVFNLPPPIGGNYWSDWTAPDADGDGFVDIPYVLNDSYWYHIQDNLPWTKQDGWKTPSDSTAPTTTASLSATSGNNGWYISDVQVTLTATDNEGGSGVAKTEYSFDGTNWTAYSAPFAVSAEGATTVYYKSTDSAGNAEAEKNLTVSIDKTLPTITGTATTSPNANDWYNTDVMVHFIASDNVSGIDTVTQDTIISTEGANQSISGTAFDKAGNSATATVSGINIDKTAPVITIASPMAAKYDHSATINISFTATDNVSGIYKTMVYLDGQQYDPANPISLLYLSLGIHTLKIESENYAGLTATQSVDFEIIATAGGTTSLVTTLYQTGAIDSAGIANSLTQKLEAVQAAISSNQTVSAKNILEAFINMLEAQSGKHISSSAAEILKADALYMISQL